jgi:hypothetical protein
MSLCTACRPYKRFAPHSARVIQHVGASVGPDSILIVDDQFVPLAEKICAVLQCTGGGPLKFILKCVGTGLISTEQWIETIYMSFSQKSEQKKR